MSLTNVVVGTVIGTCNVTLPSELKEEAIPLTPYVTAKVYDPPGVSRESVK